MVRTLVMGAVIGLICGMLFGVFYFGAGQITTPMAYVHDVSGFFLGIMIALIVYLYKKGKAK
jgi:uncharacterized membrane protein